jgi:hypothetical protein
MTSRPKRPWFRFHLLTAVLMLLAAGGMMLLNASRRLERFSFVVKPGHHRHEYGWPATAMETFGDPYIWRASGVVIDICVSVCVVMALALISESLIRRREAASHERAEAAMVSVSSSNGGSVDVLRWRVDLD